MSQYKMDFCSSGSIITTCNVEQQDDYMALIILRSPSAYLTMCDGGYTLGEGSVARGFFHNEAVILC